MNLRTLSLLLALLFTAAAAHAQAGLYGTISVSRLTNITYTSGSTTVTNAQINPLGGTVGIYYDFKNLGPIRLGVDGRGSVERDNRGAYATSNVFGSHLDTIEGGLRADIHVPITMLRPYVEGTAGLARTNYGTQFNLSNDLCYHGYAGLDLKVLPLLDIRAAEFGIGSISGSNPSRNYPEATISTGIVLHLPF